MIKVAEQVKKMHADGKLTDAQLIKFAVFVKDFDKVVNTITSKENIKLAAEKLPKFQNFNKKQLLIPAAATATVLTMSRLFDKLDDLSKEHEINKLKEQGLKDVYAVHPDLKNYNKKQVEANFNTLVVFSPALAKDPLAAGAYLKRIINMDVEGGPTHEVIKALVDIQKNHGDLNKKDQAGSDIRKELSKGIASGFSAPLTYGIAASLAGASGGVPGGYGIS